MNQLPTNEIPWTQIGAFGSFTIVVLFIALYFLTKWKKGKNSSGATMNRARCINDPRVQLGLTDLALTKESMKEMKGDMKSINEKTVEQTTILKGVLSETRKQTETLVKVCNKIGG